MTSLALLSAKGAPGVTTSALLLAAIWPGPSVLVEADPAGGDLRSWLPDTSGQPLRPDVGVVSLLAAHRAGAGQLAERTVHAHTQTLAGGLPVLVGPGTPAQAAALGATWPQLAAALATETSDAVVDLGRLSTGGPQWELLGATVLALVVTAPTVAGTAHTRDVLIRLAQRQVRTGVLVIGTDAARAQVADALGTHGCTWRLPHDPTAARSLAAGEWSRRLDRSPLLAGGRQLARDLHGTLAAFFGAGATARTADTEDVSVPRNAATAVSG
jgi:hypothetical protein